MDRESIVSYLQSTSIVVVLVGVKVLLFDFESDPLKVCEGRVGVGGHQYLPLGPPVRVQVDLEHKKGDKTRKSVLRQYPGVTNKDLRLRRVGR